MKSSNEHEPMYPLGAPVPKPQKDPAPVVERWVAIPGNPDYVKSTKTGATRHKDIF